MKSLISFDEMGDFLHFYYNIRENDRKRIVRFLSK